MNDTVEHASIRDRIGVWVFYAAFILLPFVAYLGFDGVEGTKHAGGVQEYLGGVRWQEHPKVVMFGFGMPLIFALVLMGSALRNTRIPLRLAVGLPLGSFALVTFVGLVIWLPRPSLLFGIGGIAVGIGILCAMYSCIHGIREEAPVPGMVRALGYISFAYMTWFTCGLLSMPGAAVYSQFTHDYEVIRDLAIKVQFFGLLGWALTSLGFALDRRLARKRASALAPVPTRAVVPVEVYPEMSPADAE